MRLSDDGLAFIKHFEGFRATTYRDIAGLPTIGYGHLIKKGEAFTSITVQEATVLLRQDVEAAARAVSRLITVDLSQSEFDALVSFTFNLGAGALQRSTLRRRLNRGDYDVRNEFMKWTRAGGVKSPGLVARRAAEADVFEDQGQIQDHSQEDPLKRSWIASLLRLQ